MKSRGIAAEGILLKMLLQNGIEAEPGSPSRPGDIIVLPNVIIEIKGPNANSFSFRDHAAKEEAQCKALREKKERFPWLEIFYVVRFNRKEWRFFTFPEKPAPLRLKDGSRLESMFESLLERQNSLALSIEGRLYKMESELKIEVFPDDWTEIINFLKAHSEFSFSSARLSKVFGVSSFRISKILFKLNKMGYLEKRTRGKNKKIKCFYKWKSF